jgi:hypothetical protein
MAESTLQLNIQLHGATEAAQQFRDAVRKAASTFADLLVKECLYAILPGAWPDNFILLNRYLRTGVKPEYLINE